ncbi:hypothetical protein, partial [Planococcus maritimus]|uniref:hypothetical protein n=1 Tax=Planococcus maritimus TaxID=192421 RepID=UPI00232B35AB
KKQEAIPPPADENNKSTNKCPKFISMKSQSRRAQRVKRSSETSVLLGSLRELNPKQGSE